MWIWSSIDSKPCDCREAEGTIALKGAAARMFPREIVISSVMRVMTPEKERKSAKVVLWMKTTGLVWRVYGKSTGVLKPDNDFYYGVKDGKIKDCGFCANIAVRLSYFL